MIKDIIKRMKQIRIKLIYKKGRILYDLFYKENQYKFYTDTEVVDKIVKENKSLSRFGDGEFKWI